MVAFTRPLRDGNGPDRPDRIEDGNETGGAGFTRYEVSRMVPGRAASHAMGTRRAGRPGAAVDGRTARGRRARDIALRDPFPTGEKRCRGQVAVAHRARRG